MRSSHALDHTEITFDDDHAVANAGLLLTATLATRIGLEALVDDMVDLGEHPAAARRGRKVMTLVASMVAGGDTIEDVDVLLNCREVVVLRQVQEVAIRTGDGDAEHRRSDQQLVALGEVRAE